MTRGTAQTKALRCVPRRARMVAACASAACAAISFAGCERDEAAGAASPAAEAPLTAEAAAERERGAALARGKLLSFACRACHGFAPDEDSPIGPHLHGMFGRTAASLDGFEYSAALRESGIVWTDEALDAWLAQPNDFLPGNNMAFTGFRSADDRRALIAYLRSRTDSSRTGEGRGESR